MNSNTEGIFFLTGKDFVNAGVASSKLKGILEGMGVGNEIIRMHLIGQGKWAGAPAWDCRTSKEIRTR
ncbi:MAG: hypothetical protein HY754_08895 [Nitrospirae bacterium]|nr:hypothetical protein [Nitrospirota bacterium]